MSRDAPTTAEPTNAEGSKKIKIGGSSMVFIPSEGIFRSGSQAPEEQAEEQREEHIEQPWISPVKTPSTPPPHPPKHEEPVDARTFARTPSCEPPTPAVSGEVDGNTSLLSLLDAPQNPTRSDSPIPENEDENDETVIVASRDENYRPGMIPTFHTISTTTRIPLAEPVDSTPPAALSLDSGILSRQEALAKIRERRGRARSLAQGTATPRKQMIEGVVERRDISAPAIRGGSVRSRSGART